MTKTPAILSHANVNAVLWITSLHENEQGVTRRILDDLEPYLASKEVIFQRFEPQGADHLMAYLDAVADAALAAGLAPIIHFDTHGTIEHGIHIVASKEDCLWDKITERLRAINVATGNNLCVVSLACFSFHIVRHLKFTSQTPFYLIAAPEKEVTAGYVEDSVVPFYRHVFEKNELVGAFKAVLQDKLQLLHCEEILFRTLAGYIRAACMGENVQRRVNEMLDEARKLGILVCDSDVAPFRRLIKEQFKPKQELLDKLVTTFLLGRAVPYTIEQVVEQAQKMVDPYADGRRRRPTVAESLDRGDCSLENIPTRN